MDANTESNSSGPVCAPARGPSQLPQDAFLTFDPPSPTPEPQTPLQRANKRLRQRAVTLPGKMSRAKLAQLKRENAAALSEYPGVELPGLPANFGECLELFGETRPCPFVRCKHHLALDVKPAVDDLAAVKVNFPDGKKVPDILTIPETCSLRSAVFHPEGQTLEDVASKMNITRERARQIEAVALAKMRGGMSPFHPSDDYDDHWDDVVDPIPGPRGRPRKDAQRAHVCSDQCTGCPSCWPMPDYSERDE